MMISAFVNVGKNNLKRPPTLDPCLDQSELMSTGQVSNFSWMLGSTFIVI